MKNFLPFLLLFLVSGILSYKLDKSCALALLSFGCCLMNPSSAAPPILPQHVTTTSGVQGREQTILPTLNFLLRNRGWNYHNIESGFYHNNILIRMSSRSLYRAKRARFFEGEEYSLEFVDPLMGIHRLSLGWDELSALPGFWSPKNRQEWKNSILEILEESRSNVFEWIDGAGGKHYYGYETNDRGEIIDGTIWGRVLDKNEYFFEWVDGAGGVHRFGFRLGDDGAHLKGSQWGRIPNFAYERSYKWTHETTGRQHEFGYRVDDEGNVVAGSEWGTSPEPRFVKPGTAMEPKVIQPGQSMEPRVLKKF